MINTFFEMFFNKKLVAVQKLDTAVFRKNEPNYTITGDNR